MAREIQADVEREKQELQDNVQRLSEQAQRKVCEGRSGTKGAICLGHGETHRHCIVCSCEALWVLAPGGFERQRGAGDIDQWEGLLLCTQPTQI